MLAAEIGVGQLSMGLVAERVGVTTLALDNPVDSLADLTHRIAVLAMDELRDCVRDAAQRRVESDALMAVARAMRAYVNEHPGRFQTRNTVTPGDFSYIPEPTIRVTLDRRFMHSGCCMGL